MARSTDRTVFKRDAERRFPHRIDIPVPGSGLGRRLTDMLDWCREHVVADDWAQHGHGERRKGEAPVDFARFYFMNHVDADAFRSRWRGDADEANRGRERAVMRKVGLFGSDFRQ
jgi:hypothetical protein